MPKGKQLFSIRAAESGDLDAMVRIARAAWRPIFDSFREIMGSELFDVAYTNWQDDKERQIRNAADTSTPVQFLVAEQDRVVVGFVSWVVTSVDGNKIAEIGNNAVDPEYQNRGIAASLYDAVIGTCRDSGVTAMKVTTGLDPSHAPARRAYEKAGFAHGVPMVTYWRSVK